MTDNETFTPLEDRLRAEADRLSGQHGQQVPFSAVKTELQRRRRSGRRRLAAAVAAGTLLLAGAGTYVGWRWTADAPGDGRDRPAVAHRQDPATRPEPGPAKTIEAVAQDRPPPRRDPPVYPLVITTGDGGQRSVIFAGTYRPPWTKPVKRRQLSPEDQFGLKRWAGTDQQVTVLGPI